MKLIVTCECSYVSGQITCSQDTSVFASVIVAQMCKLGFSAHSKGSKNKVMINNFCFSDSDLTRWDFQSFKFSSSSWSPQ